MKSFVALLTVVAVVTADVSHLQRSPEVDAQTISQSAVVAPDGFSYGYQTNNGIIAQESGQLTNVGKENEGISVQGSNSYTAPNGDQIALTYTADENGYRPIGAHLPTPPPTQPIPDYILKSIAYTASQPKQQEPIRKL